MMANNITYHKPTFWIKQTKMDFGHGNTKKTSCKILLGGLCLKGDNLKLLTKIAMLINKGNDYY